MYRTYPEQLTEDVLYYIGIQDEKNWTLFKRNYIQFDPNTINEFHPYNLFGDELLPSHCTPNETFLKFMVDALNEKVKREMSKNE